MRETRVVTNRWSLSPASPLTLVPARRVSMSAEVLVLYVPLLLASGLTCLVSVRAGKEHAETVVLVPVAPHALLKDICLHNEVWKGSVTADGQRQGPQRLLLLAGGAGRAQQQPRHWAAGLLPCHHCFLVLWQCCHQTPAGTLSTSCDSLCLRSFRLDRHRLALLAAASAKIRHS